MVSLAGEVVTHLEFGMHHRNYKFEGMRLTDFMSEMLLKFGNNLQISLLVPI